MVEAGKKNNVSHPCIVLAYNCKWVVSVSVISFLLTAELLPACMLTGVQFKAGSGQSDLITF
jgi:hypothetical protein